ncbi:hypothetical protein [Accumulibacter sp.]|uniref:hypothetical protein n=2 Tax=Accumulibacter sp. TaxID=2053492 RepID=UPI001AC3A3B9|nr:hypothetical protein [Accumulibacter sp.]MBN8516086.1 hypothetical protein [Accumulibacter sp.]
MPGSARLVSRALLLFSAYLLPVDQALAVELDPGRDLRVSFSTQGTEKGAGFVTGEVSRIEPQDFSCVLLEFGLFTRFDQKRAGQASQRLGVFPVRVDGLGSQATVVYRKALPFPAGIRLEKVSTCPGEPAKEATKEAAKGAGPPQIVAFKATPNPVQRGGSVTFSWEVHNADRVRLFDESGEIETRNLLPSGQRGWPLATSGDESMAIDEPTTFRLLAQKNDGKRVSASTTVRLLKAQSASCRIFGKVTGTPVRARLSPKGPMEIFQLAQVGVFVPGERQPTLRARVDAQGNYSFATVPGNQGFRVAPLGPSWRYDHGDDTVACLPGRSVRVDFAIQGVLND